MSDQEDRELRELARKMAEGVASSYWGGNPRAGDQVAFTVGNQSTTVRESLARSVEFALMEFAGPHFLAARYWQKNYKAAEEGKRRAEEERDDARNLAAEVSMGITHLPHDTDSAPCVRCLREQAEDQLRRAEEERDEAVRTQRTLALKLAQPNTRAEAAEDQLRREREAGEKLEKACQDSRNCGHFGSAGVSGCVDRSCRALAAAEEARR